MTFKTFLDLMDYLNQFKDLEALEIELANNLKN